MEQWAKVWPFSWMAHEPVTLGLKFAIRIHDSIAQMSRLAREVAVERLDRRLLLSKVQSSIKAALGT